MSTSDLAQSWLVPWKCSSTSWASYLSTSPWSMLSITIPDTSVNTCKTWTEIELSGGDIWRHSLSFLWPNGARQWAVTSTWALRRKMLIPHWIHGSRSSFTINGAVLTIRFVSKLKPIPVEIQDSHQRHLRVRKIEGTGNGCCDTWKQQRTCFTWPSSASYPLSIFFGMVSLPPIPFTRSLWFSCVAFPLLIIQLQWTELCGKSINWVHWWSWEV